jgi:glycosyltransferase involved in cell wall biosynthesis
MKISIITVCFNSAKTIASTMQSIAQQAYTLKEHIVIDGASTDNTVIIVKQFASVDHVLSEPDSGVYDAMNKGIALATGNVIGFLNADDIYMDDTVLTQVANCFADSNVDACYADLLYVNADNTDKIVRYWQSCAYKLGMFKKGWMPAHPTFFVRRHIYEQYGGFDLQYKRQADFDLTLRFLEIHKINAVYVPRIWVKMRMGGMSNNSIIGIIKGNVEAYRACIAHGFNVFLPIFILQKISSRLPQYFKRPS